ncbi:hypothetical protein JCM5350_007268 [Sporobolomyces pararoseus]
MSTSSTPSTLKQLGKCVVCGKETHLRCGECLKQGLDWMYFCCIEHKKAIWYTHKRVCGVNSNPFRMPAFSPIEFKALLETLPDEHSSDPEIRPWTDKCG